MAGQRTMQKKLNTIIGTLVLRKFIHEIDIFYTQKKHDGYMRAKNCDKSYDFIVTVGGDGTINEVISGIIEGKHNIPIVILAAGTVNDFAKSLQIPQAADAICDMIINFKTMACDVGKINQQYFINVAAGGMFSDVSFLVSKEEKKHLGPLAYYINGLINLPSQLRTNIPIQIKIDDQEVIEEDIMLFLISNTSRVGGFEEITPHANIQDGLLDLLIIKKCSLTDLVALSKDYFLRRHIASPFLLYKQARKIELSCVKNTITVDIDGEKGQELPAVIENIKSAITIVIP